MKRGVGLGLLLMAGCDSEPAVIDIRPGETYQTISGWEAHAQSGAGDPAFETFRDTLFDLAVNDLGINRVRIESWSGVEQRRDWSEEHRLGRIDYAEWQCRRFATENDNDDSDVINWSGFHFTQLDASVERVVQPLQRLLAARGERLYVNLTYDSFILQCPGAPYVHDRIPEYAEFALATFLHLREKFGLVPDAWEMILEPDNSNWRGQAIGEALVATGDLLKEHGFEPEFIAPSTTKMANAVEYFDALIQVPRAREYLTEIAYHRYGLTTTNMAEQIGERGTHFDLRTSMLEHIGSGYEDLHEDLKVANVSAWQQFALAFPTKDNGAQYFVITDGKVELGSRTRFLRQYFRYIRAGATRIGAGTTDERFDPLAFRDAEGLVVVVIKADRKGDMQVRGLAPGDYATTYTTDAESLVSGPDLRVEAGGEAIVSIPDRGVLTLFRR